MLSDTEKLVVEKLKNNNFGKTDNILEFGFGSGAYSKLLREAFPDSFITGLDRNKMFNRKSNNADNYLSRMIFEDLNVFSEKDESFDFITLGAMRLPFWWKFNCYNKKTFNCLLESLFKLLSKDGKFIFLIKTEFTENERQRNNNMYTNYFCKQILVDKSDFDSFTNNNIVDDIINILTDLGKFHFSEVRIKDVDKIKASTNSLLSELDKKFSNTKGIGILKRKILNEGIEYSPVTLLIAEKI